MNPSLTGLSATKLALAIERAREEGHDTDLAWSEPIAVVGIGCRFSNGVATAADYWRLLLDRTDTIRGIPSDRWSAEQWYDPDPLAAGKTSTKWGGFVDAIDRFDPVFFGIAPREAPSIDPQHRLLLEVAWEALADAAIPPERLAGTATGVFVGICKMDYGRLLLADPARVGPNTLAGASHSIASGRIAYLLDLRGPAVSIDTACSSSLMAIHLACQSLRSGESDTALAGGVSLHATPEHFISLAKLGMLSPTGRCFTFDARADGFVAGEGCGVVVLKRLGDAFRDGDRIHAVVRGTAAVQDGRTTVLTAPNGLAQQDVIRAALRNGGVRPDQVSFVETHGTGTQLGDPIEVEALAEALGDGVPCPLGAVKTNLGHLEAAAGVAGFIKAALALEREVIPPNAHFETINPHIALDGTRFVVPTEARPWPRGSSPRFAGVSSFGFSGTNAHVVLEEGPRMPAPPPVPGPVLVPISARTPEAVLELAGRYRGSLEAGDRLDGIGRTSALGRSHYEERIAVVAATPTQLVDRLGEVVAGRGGPGISRSRATAGQAPVFVFSGQGSQWPGMGLGLLGREVFRRSLEESDRLLIRWAGWSLIAELERAGDDSRLAATAYAQPAIVALEIALARLLMSWGVRPGAVIGHSVGEIAAIHLAGGSTIEDAIRVAVARGRLMQQATGLGRMAAVALSEADTVAAIGPLADRVSLAAVNGPRSTVISGAPDAVEGLVAGWKAGGIAVRMLPVDYAFHSVQMDPFVPDLVAEVGRVGSADPQLAFFSTVSGRREPGALGAGYWGRNLREPVRFDPAVRAAIEAGFTTFVEIGAHPVVTQNVAEILADTGTDGAAIPTLRREQDEAAAALAAAGTLYARGHDLDWAELYAAPAPVVSLPSYPYQRERYWIAPGSAGPGTGPALRPMLDRRVRTAVDRAVIFESDLGPSRLPFLADHRIGEAVILPMAGFLELVSEAVRESRGPAPFAINDAVVHRPLVFAEDGVRTVQTVLEGDRFQVFSLEDERWTLHLEGRIGAGSGIEPTAIEGPLEARRVAEHYRLAASRGAGFGPAFQTVVDLAAANGHARAKLALSVASSPAAGFVLHPTLLDGAFQAVLATEAGGNGTLWIPVSVDRYEVAAPAGSEAVAVVTIRKAEGAETLTADVTIETAAGAPAAVIEGLRFVRHRQNQDDELAGQRYALGWHSVAVVGRPDSRSRRRVVLDPDGEIGPTLVELLTGRGDTAEVRGLTAPLDGCDDVIYVVPPGGEDPALAEERTAETLALLSRMVSSGNPPPALWLVTRGAEQIRDGDAVDPSAGAVTALARTLRHEHRDARCVTVDLDSSGGPTEIATEVNGEGIEERVAWRAGTRYAARLERDRAQARSADSYRLIAPAPGLIENLRVDALDRRAPGVGEVEIRVEAVSLNFRDVLVSLGLYPGAAVPLGVEFSGRIERVGPGEPRWRPDDRVMGIGWGSLASHVVTDRALVAPVPAALDPEAAATLPNAFVTARYCLAEVARLAPGETVLIHAGAGGVGMAALQVALARGARVIATAGTEQKRALLRSLGAEAVFSSRDLDFVEGIGRHTGGRGVDVALNSLAGVFIGATLGTLREGGRFVEIGKTEIWSPEAVAALGRSIEYTIVDLAAIVDHDPGTVGAHLDAVAGEVSAGSLRPLPRTVFRFAEHQDAFRFMAAARHVGRVVLRMPVPYRARPGAGYLVTGGLGGVGRAVAGWLADRGVERLYLVGRTAPTPRAEADLAEIRSRGVDVRFRAVDVADADQVAGLLAEIGRDGSGLAGVIHAAGVVDDGLLINQSRDRLAAVLAAKAFGARHLDRMTRHLDLDFFLLIGSMASVLGSPTQATYAAANGYLDGLAAARRRAGKHAVSVSWGAWAGEGMAGRVEATGRRRVLEALRPVPAETYLRHLDRIVSDARTHLPIAEVDWSSWDGPRISELTSLLAPEPSAAAAGPTLAQRMAEVGPAGQRALLIELVRSEARRVLGLGPNHPIDDRQPLLRLGLDSLMAIELRNRLAAELERPLPATLLFDHPSADAIARLVLGRSPDRVEPDERGEALRQIAEMSDEEAEALLERELGL